MTVHTMTLEKPGCSVCRMRSMICWLLLIPFGLNAESGKDSPSFLEMAKEVTSAVHRDYWMEDRSLYRHEIGKDDPEMIWGGGILFSMLTAASRHEPDRYQAPLVEYFEGLESYWDTGVEIPGYEPSPTSGGGNDKYYDDNAWMVLTLAEAYQVTGLNSFIRRSYDTLIFVVSGWDETLGGGIWWHEGHKGNCKNTCINAPAAVGCLTLAKYRESRRPRLIRKAEEIVAWTREHLQNEVGLYMDHIRADTGEVDRVTLTYNSALMLRAELMLYKATGDAGRLQEAVRIGRAAERLCHSGTLVFRDAPKWSHLMLEADLDLHRETGEQAFLERAEANGESYYQRWKDGEAFELIDLASIARGLWLLADGETAHGREFWKTMDAPTREGP